METRIRFRGDSKKKDFSLVRQALINPERKARGDEQVTTPIMVQHNDKWKKKASREYHKKHGTQPAGSGRGRGAGVTEEDAREPLEEQIHDEADSEAEDSNDESGEEQETRRSRSKYARRKIESNAWRFEEEEPDPYLGISLLSLIQSSTKMIWNLQSQITHISPPVHSRRNAKYRMLNRRQQAQDEERSIRSARKNWRP